jgi:hypothetical protein
MIVLLGSLLKSSEKQDKARWPFPTSLKKTTAGWIG